jgi:hypothetical protein
MPGLVPGWVFPLGNSVELYSVNYKDSSILTPLPFFMSNKEKRIYIYALLTDGFRKYIPHH